MPSDAELLRDLNREIVRKESDGDVDYFERLLAPAFAMRRARSDTAAEWRLLSWANTKIL